VFTLTTLEPRTKKREQDMGGYEKVSNVCCEGKQGNKKRKENKMQRKNIHLKQIQKLPAKRILVAEELGGQRRCVMKDLRKR
jgi:hypothetical protein